MCAAAQISETRPPRPGDPERCDDGFMLLTALVMVFLVLLVLSVAAPRMARAIQHDRELESAHRAQQYVRAVRIFYIKFKRYPTSIEQLEKTNNQRFLRQRYVDPLTGKDDWRLIHVGENQTTVKGFFGDDLPGLPTGLGSAAGMQSSTGNTPAFGSSPSPTFGNNPQSPTSPNPQGQGQTGPGTPGATTPGASGSTPSNGIASQDATSFTGSGGAPIIGIGSARSGEAMLVVNEQTTYETWEFLYDPRIEQLYAKGSLLGGIASGTGTNGFGTTPGTGNNGLPPPPPGFGNNPPGFGNTPPNNPGNNTFGPPANPTTPPAGTTPP
jgi:type II secretory pathway pseudopilin PulG